MGIGACCLPRSSRKLSRCSTSWISSSDLLFSSFNEDALSAGSDDGSAEQDHLNQREREESARVVEAKRSPSGLLPVNAFSVGDPNDQKN